MFELALHQGDITTFAADVIVNAANAALAGGGGVDGAIHRAGGPTIMAQCRTIGGCPTGSAVITGAGDLQARHVVHAVAPRYSGNPQDALDLRSAYTRSLELADAAAAASVLCPSLGTGAYGYPVEDAARIALTAVLDYRPKANALTSVGFVLYSRTDFQIYARILAECDS